MLHYNVAPDVWRDLADKQTTESQKYRYLLDIYLPLPYLLWDTYIKYMGITAKLALCGLFANV